MTDPKDLRRRLDAVSRVRLTRGDAQSVDLDGLRRTIRRLHAQSQERALHHIVYRRDIPNREPAPEHLFSLRGRPIALEKAVRGIEVSAPGGGKAYLVSTRAEEIKKESARLAEKFRCALAREDSNLRRRFARTRELANVRPGDILFVDLETTGLMGTPLFLIGTMVCEEGGLAIRQYLARDYSEEPAVIRLLTKDTSGKKLLVTFNGKAFDLPYIRLRAAANAIPFALHAAHFDLLQECRCIWRDVLPNCKLRTLESLVCGRVRDGDISGEHIGEAYHAFVRTGNAVQMGQILRHNVLDLITMADLMVRLTEVPAVEP